MHQQTSHDSHLRQVELVTRIGWSRCLVYTGVHVTAAGKATRGPGQVSDDPAGHWLRGPIPKTTAAPLEGSFSFLCLHAAVALTPLLPKAHSLLLTSGTLSPVAPLVAELGLGHKPKRQHPLPDGFTPAGSKLSSPRTLHTLMRVPQQQQQSLVTCEESQQAPIEELSLPVSSRPGSAGSARQAATTAAETAQNSDQLSVGTADAMQLHVCLPHKCHAGQGTAHQPSLSKRQVQQQQQQPTGQQQEAQQQQQQQQAGQQQQEAQQQQVQQDQKQQQVLQQVQQQQQVQQEAEPQVQQQVQQQQVQQQQGQQQAMQQQGQQQVAQQQLQQQAAQQHGVLQQVQQQLHQHRQQPVQQAVRLQHATLHEGVELVSAPHHHTLPARLLPLTISMAPGGDGRLVKLDSAYERRQDTGMLFSTPFPQSLLSARVP